jgi:hypothetical protein
VKPKNPDQTIGYFDEVHEYDIQATDSGAGELVATTDIYTVDLATHERKGDAAKTASFTNAVKTGSVSLTKAVEGSDAAGKEFVFDVALKDSAGNALDGEYTWMSSRNDSDGNAITGTVKNGGTLRLQKDEMVTISGLPAGNTYEFAEADAAGYTQSKSSNLSGSIEADDTVEASATNTYAATGTAQIKARKVVLGSGQETAPGANAFMFTLNARSDENSDNYDEAWLLPRTMATAALRSGAYTRLLTQERASCTRSRSTTMAETDMTSTPVRTLQGSRCKTRAMARLTAIPSTAPMRVIIGRARFLSSRTIH